MSTSLPPRIQLVEVAPRDGLQAEERVLSTDVKVALIERLADAGHTVIEATSFVDPKAVPQLADAGELLPRLRRRAGVRYPVLVPNEKGLERAVAAGATEIAVFASASESYSRKNLNKPRDEAIEGYASVVRRATKGGLRARGYLSMIVADPWDGPTDPATVVECARRLLAMGCDELSLADTTGVGTPAQIARVLGAMADADMPLDRVALHLHDTYGQGLACALTAMDLGVTTFDTSTGGIGGSPFARMAGGNVATEDLVYLCDGMGIETGIDLDAIVATARWLVTQLGHELPAHVSRALAARATP